MLRKNFERSLLKNKKIVCGKLCKTVDVKEYIFELVENNRVNVYVDGVEDNKNLGINETVFCYSPILKSYFSTTADKIVNTNFIRL